MKIGHGMSDFRGKCKGNTTTSNYIVTDNGKGLVYEGSRADIGYSQKKARELVQQQQ